MKRLERKLIDYDEFEKLEENRKRVFIITYVNSMNPATRKEKLFQNKRYVRTFLNNRNIEKIKLYVGDVIEQTRI